MSTREPEPESWAWGLGPTAEAGVGLDCLDCSFQTADERKADAHNALTGHRIAIDYIDHESEWPTS
jgi:uncharacterized ferredoxin-like protein